MATDKKFEVAGYSTLNGKTKLRFANDIMRIKILNKRDHINVELVSLPFAMSKREIAEYMIANGIGTQPEVVSAIKYTLKKNPSVVSITPPIPAAVDLIGA